MKLRTLALGFGLICAVSARLLAGPVGPLPYLSSNDSPFKGLSFSYFHLEDFEDHQLSIPGVTGSSGGVTSVIFGPSIHDSVDGDDGAIDGSGLNGDDWFSGTVPLTFTFDGKALGGLPTHAGIVWTDGINPVTFTARGGNGNLLGTIGPVNIADNSFNGETAEDRFFGWIDSNGIGSITLNQPSGGIEVDHLQIGRAGGEPPVNSVPLPPGVWAALAGLLAVAIAQTQHNWRRHARVG